MEPQRIFLPLLLASTLAATPTPMPSDDAPAPVTMKKDQTQTWVLIGSAVVLGVLLLTDHAAGGCYNPNDDDNLFTTDGLPHRPAIGFTLHFPIP